MAVLTNSVPLVPLIDPQGTAALFSAGGAYANNAIIELYSNNTSYITQRPGIEIVSPNTIWGDVLPVGRGVYYWEDQNIPIAVVNDTVFTVAGAEIGTISAGKDPVWISQIGDVVVILDYANDEGWILNSALVLSSISSDNFPTTLAGGGAVLNGRLYVLDKEGVIYNSALNDPATWNALDFLEAEREPDKGIYITNLQENIVVFGTRTIEFFYDAQNPVGSLLNRREDIAHRIGAFNYNSVYNSGDIAYFISADISGSLKFMSLANFELTPLSTPQISRYLDARVTQGNSGVLLSGSHMHGHSFTYVTFVTDQGESWFIDETLVYDGTTNHFTGFYTQFEGIKAFPLISWARRQDRSTKFSYGITASAQIIRFSGIAEPIDRQVNEPYYEPGYVQEGYIENVGGPTGEIVVPITMSVRTELWDASQEGAVSARNKFIYKTELIGSNIASFVEDGETIGIRWTDDNYQTYSQYRQVPLGIPKRLTGCGRTRRRAFEITYTGQNRIRVEKIDLTFGLSSYA